MDLSGMNRKEKFRYLKANGVKCKANMKTVQLDKLIIELDKYQRGELEEKPSGVDKREARESKRRVPLGQHRQQLSTDHLNIPKDKVARWVNDKPGRISRALEGGYELVRNPEKETPGERSLTTGALGDSVSAIVGTTENNQPLRAYLMVIDRDLYEEDQDFKLRELDKTDQAIQSGTLKPDDEGAQYVPPSGIKYQR